MTPTSLGWLIIVNSMKAEVKAADESITTIKMQELRKLICSIYCSYSLSAKKIS